MARAKITGLGKSKGQVGLDFHLDDGDYLIKKDGGVEGQTKGGLLQYTFKHTILEGPVQQDAKEVQGMPWTMFFTLLDSEHEYYQIGVDKLKNYCNAAGIAVRADSIDPDEGNGAEFVMHVTNKARKDTGEIQSNAVAFFAVEDSSYAA